MNPIQIILRYREGFLQGLEVTLQLALITWVSGLSLGIILGAAAYRWPKSAGIGLRTIAFLLSGIPFLVLLFWAHFPLQKLLDVVIDPFYTSAFLLGTINTIIVAEIWRTALNEFRNEYQAAAMVCGLNAFQTLRYIQLPLVLRQAMPMLLALQVGMLHMTLFASLISVEELFRVAQRINSSVHKPVEIYTALGIFFLLLSIPPYLFAFWLRHRFTRDISER